jgi:hypothetical protein
LLADLNAELAVHRQAVLDAMSLHTRGWDNAIRSCGKQLAAELEKVKTLVDALEGIAENADHYADDYTEIESLRIELRGFAEQARHALAKVKEGK